MDKGPKIGPNLVLRFALSLKESIYLKSKRNETRTTVRPRLWARTCLLSLIKKDPPSRSLNPMRLLYIHHVKWIKPVTSSGNLEEKY